MVNALGVTLPLRLGANGYFQNTMNVMEQIKSNLTNLLLTQKGERVMQPEFGCTLATVIFEFQTDDGLAEIEAIVQTAVNAWMPFVRIDGVTVQRREVDKSVTVAVAFTLLTENISDSITLVF